MNLLLETIIFILLNEKTKYELVMDPHFWR